MIIAISIPLSILSSIIILNALGETLNTMTLGGLALAVGILVDDATVTIENIHRHMDGQSLFDAVLIGASEIATPTFVSTLTICIVFVSVIFLTGPAKYLFTPMALAVVFAMLASYVLSRTLVPTLVNFMLAGEVHYSDEASDHTAEAPRPSWFERFNDRFNAGYLRFQAYYTGLLHRFIEHRRIALIACACVMATAFLLLPFIGRDFFPAVDTGQIRLHVRADAGNPHRAILCPHSARWSSRFAASFRPTSSTWSSTISVFRRIPSASPSASRPTSVPSMERS